jgi:hypothetical protein
VCACCGLYIRMIQGTELPGVTLALCYRTDCLAGTHNTTTKETRGHTCALHQSEDEFVQEVLQSPSSSKDGWCEVEVPAATVLDVTPNLVHRR